MTSGSGNLSKTSFRNSLNEKSAPRGTAVSADFYALHRPNHGFRPHSFIFGIYSTYFIEKLFQNSLFSSKLESIGRSAVQRPRIPLVGGAKRKPHFKSPSGAQNLHRSVPSISLIFERSRIQSRMSTLLPRGYPDTRGIQHAAIANSGVF